MQALALKQRSSYSPCMFEERGLRRISVFLAMLLGAAIMAPQPAGARDLVRSPPAPDEAAIAILVDLSSGQVLHQRNADRRFMPASITKTMTAFLAFEMIDEGRLKLDQRMRFAPASFKHWGGVGSTLFMSAGDELPVSSLLLGITTVSANDASVVLAEGTAGSFAEWTSLMNAKAREIGMANSHFGSPNGWPDEGRTFVTGRDLTKLASAMIQRHPQLYKRFFGHRRLTYRGITQPNHDPFTGQVQGGDGIKTGFTNEAGYGFLGSAQRGGRRLVLVVAGADRPRVRDRAARSYLEWGFAAFNNRPLFSAGQVVEQARVQDGASMHVPLVAPRAIAATIPLGENPAIKLTVSYEGPLRAPISKGQHIADLEIAVEGMEPSRIPLVAGKDVSKAGVLARVVNGIWGWLG